MCACLFQEAGELDSGKDSPEEAAANFTCAMFETPQDVLKGARHMVHITLTYTILSILKPYLSYGQPI
jgi:hypothetical protein